MSCFRSWTTGGVDKVEPVYLDGQGGLLRIIQKAQKIKSTLTPLACFAFGLSVKGASPLGDIRIEVSLEGNPQGFVRMPGSDL